MTAPMPEHERQSRVPMEQHGDVLRRLDSQDAAIAEIRGDTKAIYAAIVGTLSVVGLKQRLDDLTAKGIEHEERIGALEGQGDAAHQRLRDRLWQIAQLPIGAALGAISGGMAAHWGAGR